MNCDLENETEPGSVLPHLFMPLDEREFTDRKQEISHNFLDSALHRYARVFSSLQVS